MPLAAGDLGHVAQQDADDLAEAEGHDRQVVAAQAQHREAEEEAEQRGHHPGDRQGGPEAEPGVLGEQRVGVGTYRVEADVAEIEQAGQADHDVQADAEHHVDQDQGGDVHAPREAKNGQTKATTTRARTAQRWVDGRLRKFFRPLPLTL